MNILAVKPVSDYKDALSKVLEEHGSTFNWALQTLNNSGGSDTPDDKGFTIPATEIANRVKRIKAKRRYADYLALFRVGQSNCDAECEIPLPEIICGFDV